MAWAEPGFRADRSRIIGCKFAGLAVEGELQNLVGAECGCVDEFVAAVRQNRVRIATGWNDMNRFRLDQSIFTNWAHRNLVATIRGRKKKTPRLVGRHVRHAVGQWRRRFLRKRPGSRID